MDGGIHCTAHLIVAEEPHITEGNCKFVVWFALLLLLFPFDSNGTVDRWLLN